MKLYAMLPPDRSAEGSLWGTEDGRVVFGPVRCRGEADNANAAQADNVVEDPTRVGGDHPFGVSRVTEVVRIDAGAAALRHTYGPAFLRLAGLSGQAWEARCHGRTGLGIHGGALGPNGTLRATYGCLRVTDDDAARLADLVEPQLAAIGEMYFECVPQEGGGGMANTLTAVVATVLALLLFVTPALAADAKAPVLVTTRSQLLTSGTSFTVPTGVSLLWVTLIGAGGGGGASAAWPNLTGATIGFTRGEDTR